MAPEFPRCWSANLCCTCITAVCVCFVGAFLSTCKSYLSTPFPTIVDIGGVDEYESLSSDRASWTLCGSWSSSISIAWTLPLQEGCGPGLLDWEWTIFFWGVWGCCWISGRGSAALMTRESLRWRCLCSCSKQQLRGLRIPKDAVGCFAPICTSDWIGKCTACPAPLRGIWCRLANTQHWFLKPQKRCRNLSPLRNRIKYCGGLRGFEEQSLYSSPPHSRAAGSGTHCPVIKVVKDKR